MTGGSRDSIKINVIGGVLTAAVLGAGGAVWAFAPSGWKWFAELLGSMWAHLTGPATVPTWWLYILYAIGTVALAAVVLIVRESVKKETFTEYTKDRFFGAVWRWRYAHRVPAGIWAFCPSCDTVLVYSHDGTLFDQRTTLHCETCERSICTQPGDKDELVGKVQRQIDRKIRTGEWKNYVERIEAQT